MAYDGARLTISTAGTVKMQVEVDGRHYNMKDKGISIRDFHSGYHSIRIYRVKRLKNWLLDSGFGNRQELVYSNSFFLRNGYHLDLLINRFGKIFIDEHQMDRNDDWYNNDDDEGDNQNDRDNRDNRSTRYDNNYNKVIDDYDFNQAKQDLQKEWFENTGLLLPSKYWAKTILPPGRLKNYCRCLLLRTINLILLNMLMEKLLTKTIIS